MDITLHTVDNVIAKVNNGTLRNIAHYMSNISFTNHKTYSAIHRKSSDNNGVEVTYDTERGKHDTGTRANPLLYALQLF